MARWEYDFQELQIVEKWLSTAQAKKFQELRDQMNAKGSQGSELLGVHTLDVVGGVTGKALYGFQVGGLSGHHPPI